MKLAAPFAALSLAAFPSLVWADPPTGAALVAARPWEAAQALVKVTEADIDKDGIVGVKSHVPDLEAVLSSAKSSPESANEDKGTVYVLTDGDAETLMALAAATAKNSPVAGRKVVAVQNPYPIAGLYLGSYYDEIGRPEDAIRVIDEGMNSAPITGVDLGEHEPVLIAERGAALTALKRWPEALADYERGLAISNLPPRAEAILLRGRGFALTELGRLDEAEKSYRDSLTYEPGNARAHSELEYIARLRAGGSREATGIDIPSAAKPK